MNLNLIVKVILATLTAGLARAVGGRHPKVRGSGIKNHNERLRRSSNGDGSVVGELRMRQKSLLKIRQVHSHKQLYETEQLSINVIFIVLQYITYISIIGHGFSAVLGKFNLGVVGILLSESLPQPFLLQLFTDSFSFDQGDPVKHIRFQQACS